MHRLVTVALIVALPDAARAESSDAEAVAADAADDDDGNAEAATAQGIGAALGIAIGGRTTPGGLRVDGHYTYRMTSNDYFDGTVGFTFGSGGAACFRDRENDVLCDHGFLDGAGIEVAAGVRRYFAAKGTFQPFVRLAVGVGLVRFGDDDVVGIAVPLHGGAGLRVRVASGVSVVAFADGALGVARFASVGVEPHAGMSITAGAELRLP